MTLRNTLVRILWTRQMQWEVGMGVRLELDIPVARKDITEVLRITELAWVWA